MIYVDLPLQNQYFCTHWGLSKKECIQTFLKLSQFFCCKLSGFCSYKFFCCKLSGLSKKECWVWNSDTPMCYTNWLPGKICLKLFCSQAKKFILFFRLFCLNANFTWQIITHKCRVTIFSKESFNHLRAFFNGWFVQMVLS